MTIDDLASEYVCVKDQYVYWSVCARGMGADDLAVHSRVLGLYNQAAALETLYRRALDPGRWAVGPPLDEGIRGAAIDLLGSTIDRLTP